MQRPIERSGQFHCSDEEPARCGKSWEWASQLCLREARRLGLSEPDAQDVAQEALLRSWRFRGQLQGAPPAWLSTIVRNEARRHWARRAQDLAPEALDRHTAEDRSEQAELRVDIARAARHLDPADRAMLEMHYRLGLTYPMLAGHFDLPVGTVKVRLHRARLRLRPYLAQGRL